MRSAAAALVLLALLVGGCGSDRDFANAPRPPAELTISATVAPARVSVSPSRIGAGVIELLASNQTPTSQRVTLRSDPGATGRKALEQSVGPINPGDTASLKADLSPGSYRVSVGAGKIAPAQIEVGPPRASGPDRPVQP